jgi:hypothetical protein
MDFFPSSRPNDEKKTADDKKELPPLTQPQLDSLLKLADERSEAVKDYLIKTSGIASDRLLTCSPATEDSPKSFPKATLSLL